MRTRWAYLLLLCCLPVASAAKPPAAHERGAAFSPQTAAESEQCCKVCTKGKACGDSCIARDKQCHKPPGCACDG